MRVLGSFVGGWGHAAPLLPLLDALRGRGDDVVVVGEAGAIPRLAAAGYRSAAVGPPTLRTEPTPLIPVDLAAEREVAREVFCGSLARARLGELVAVFEQERPDLIVCDEADLAAVAVGGAHRVPTVVVSVIAAGRLFSDEVVGDVAEEFLAEAGAAGRPRRGDRFVVPVAPSFRDPDVELVPRATHVRPPVLDAPRVGHDPAGHVYVTLGTVFDLESGDLFARLGAAVSRLEQPVLVTVGDRVDPASLGSVGPNVRVERFVPVEDATSGASAVVCHGGSGTLVAALARGVPVVVLPMGADQPDNADRVVSLGLGVALDAISATSHEVVAAVGRIAEAEVVSAVTSFARACAALPPVSSLLDDVDELVLRHRRR